MNFITLKDGESKYIHANGIGVDGIKAALVTIHDDGATDVEPSKMIKPELIFLTFTNATTGVDVERISLVEWWALRNKGRDSLNPILGLKKNIAYNVFERMQDYGFELPPQWGAIQMKIEVAQGAVQTATKTGSFVQIGFNLTTAPMSAAYGLSKYEANLIPQGIDFNGASSVVAMDTNLLKLGAATVIFPKIEPTAHISIKSAEEESAYDEYMARSYHNDLCENPHEFDFPQLMLHAGNVITKGHMTWKKATASTALYIETVHPTDEAEISERKSLKLMQQTADNLTTDV